MKFIKSKKGIAILASLVVAVAAAVGAYAYFTTSGTGHSTVTIGTPTPWTVTFKTPTGGPMTPNGPTESLGYTIRNTGSGAQQLNQAVISVLDSDGVTPYTFTDAGGDPACTAADFTIDGGAAGASATDTTTGGALPIVLAPGSAYNGTILLKMIDNGANQDSCIGQVVPIFVAAS